MKQITEDYCNKDISVMLKEKGFDVPVKNHFSLNKDAMLHNLDKKYGAKKNWNAFEICISRPSQSLALKWLREVHNIHIEIRYMPSQFTDEPTYKAMIWNMDTEIGTPLSPDISYTYFETCIEEALKYTLENLI